MTSLSLSPAEPTALICGRLSSPFTIISAIGRPCCRCFYLALAAAFSWPSRFASSEHLNPRHPNHYELVEIHSDFSVEEQCPIACGDTAVRCLSNVFDGRVRTVSRDLAEGTGTVPFSRTNSRRGVGHSGLDWIYLLRQTQLPEKTAVGNVNNALVHHRRLIKPVMQAEATKAFLFPS